MALTKEQLSKSMKTIERAVKEAGGVRQLARNINIDSADITRWKLGHSKIRTEAVISLARLYQVIPNDLRPDLFPEDVIVTFKGSKK